MLSSSALYELLLQAREVYTHIVMDSPPILSVVDGVILAQQADANVLIVRDGKTRKHSLQRALALLTHSDIRTTGLVLNFADN
jgi:Mrp family chromosome partitioning ATPase